MKKLMVLVMLVGMLWGCANIKVDKNIVIPKKDFSFKIVLDDGFKKLVNKKVFGVDVALFQGPYYKAVSVMYMPKYINKSFNIGDITGEGCYAIQTESRRIANCQFNILTEICRSKTSRVSYLLSKTLTTYAQNDKATLIIKYVEEVDMPRVIFSDWDPLNLTQEQKKYVQDFNNRFRASVKIVPIP